MYEDGETYYSRASQIPSAIESMKILSVNVGAPRTFEWRGRTFTTAIFKEPVAGPARVEGLGFVDDTQADRAVHGGIDKAVYLYSTEHYPDWEALLGERLLPGAMGENLTASGFLEEELAIGDEIEVGSALLGVSEPRLPCRTLAARYRRPDMQRLFTEMGRPGSYFRVLRDGVVQGGDEGRAVRRARERWTVGRVFRLLTDAASAAPGEVERLATLDGLGTGARRKLVDRSGLAGSVGEASAEEAAVIGRLLDQAGLPRDGFPADTPVVLAAKAPEGEVVGGVALELHGEAALLRSAVVSPGHAGVGWGKALVRAAVERAWGEGASSVSLLTESAEGFFPRFGFEVVERVALPDALAGSVELTGACPESAVAMTLRVPGRRHAT